MVIWQDENQVYKVGRKIVKYWGNKTEVKFAFVGLDLEKCAVNGWKSVKTWIIKDRWYIV